MGTHLRVLSESYPNEYIFEKSLNTCVWDKSTLSIGWVKENTASVVISENVSIDRESKCLDIQQERDK